MSTTSTRSRRRKRSGATQSTSRKKDDAPAIKPGETGASAASAEIDKRNWRLVSAAILITGAFLRLYDLSLVPLHHDEGVNGNFLVTLVRNGAYQYDPQNYHGPTLYYFSAVIPWIFRFFGGKSFGDAHGLTTFNIRLVTAAFGVATIWLGLLLRKRLGTIGALSAAGLIAISPGAVYLSRYFIHESLFVFFTLGIVVAALKYYDTTRPVYLILASISAALMVATKETWIINGPVLLIALATTCLYVWFGHGKSRQVMLAVGGLFAGGLLGFLFRPSVDSAGQLAFRAVITRGLYPRSLDPSAVPVAATSFNFTVVGAILGAAAGFIIGRRIAKGKRLPSDVGIAERIHVWIRKSGGWPVLLTYALFASSIFLFIDVLFYSSFFTNYPKGVQDAVSTITQWSHRTHEHAHPGWQYLEWLRQEEAPALILGAVGIVIAVWQSKNRFAIFIALGTFGLVAAYSLVEYKTPWISLNFIVPLAIAGGYTLEVLYQKLREFDQPRVFIALAIFIVAVCGYQMYQLNFVHYDDDKYAYVYAHTRREMLAMLEETEHIAKRLGSGNDTGIAIVSPEYWPLPWYFRDYKRVGYYQQIVPTTEPIIIGSTAQEEQLKSTYGDRYELVNSGLASDGSYSLRPGVDLLLYVRRDVAR